MKFGVVSSLTMKVYSAPASIKKPEFPTGLNGDWKAYQQKEDAYANEIVAYAKKHGKGSMRGKEVNFPIADGYARYIVFTNTSLIHLDVGDAWNYPYVQRLLVKDIREQVTRQEAIAKLFAQKKGN